MDTTVTQAVEGETVSDVEITTPGPEGSFTAPDVPKVPAAPRQPSVQPSAAPSAAVAPAQKPALPRNLSHQSLTSFHPNKASHAWHEISVGDKAPDVINVVIEIPQHSKVKHELDKETGLLYVDRVLYSSVVYPHNYGFAPQTLCEDHDPLDVLVLMQEPVHPMSMLQARPIGVLHMLDQGEQDDKVIAVHVHDPAFNGYTDVSQLPPHRLLEIRQFFEDYKKNENKAVAVDVINGAEEAKKVVATSIQLYRDQYVPKKRR